MQLQNIPYYVFESRKALRLRFPSSIAYYSIRTKKGTKVCFLRRTYIGYLGCYLTQYTRKAFSICPTMLTQSGRTHASEPINIKGLLVTN